MITAPNFLDLEWLDHGFGERDSTVPAGVRTIKQVHSSVVFDAAVSKETDTGDALISDRAGILVGVKTADCVPILLVDPSVPVVAAIHAGWRGSAENIVAAVVHELTVGWNTRPENLRAAIGPSIGVCCYEVGPEVARRFDTWDPKMRQIEGPVHLDLPTINQAQLRNAGVSDIWKSGECTFCAASRFFSFRREREKAGRLVSFIGLQKNIGRASCSGEHWGPPGKP
jgi:YfiH family protein